ncbi:hit family protein 1 [Nadsonia fulvescens var. elongata DSM 6958]|uniref:Adenosine 5'-monophosphoramidase HNT1 n=1 Tax=Nadsonia fulvescens var. elongata DSM 6958 TaxID=857566 RepID=A0A1E3PEB7_9ASCO|nr:hit family protein 1 [Nadsonia fulvescens var. elongata DSM 6958]
MSSLPTCIFCKIIKGEIPCFKLFETDTVLAYLDIQPLSKGHALIIPKYHGARLHNIPDEYLSDVLPITKKIAKAVGVDNDDPEGKGIGYNFLQNNGRIAHQEVDHVHFHVIPKRVQTEGLGVGWPAETTDFDKLKKLHEELLKAIGN